MEGIAACQEAGIKVGLRFTMNRLNAGEIPAIFDLLEMHAKTGIAHRALRPVMGIVDPDNTRTLPKMVAACTGLDVLSHALESLTALPYHQRPAPESPRMRPAYQGASEYMVKPIAADALIEKLRTLG